ncbi:histone H3-K79 methyltransferase [Phytophthora cactorum]|nr:histone H3-K79 methyltransferase [Phytophthora cactorum]
MRTSFQDWEDKLLVQIALQFEHEGLRITWDNVARRMAKTKRSGRKLRQRLVSLKRTYGKHIQDFPPCFFGCIRSTVRPRFTSVTLPPLLHQLSASAAPKAASQTLVPAAAAVPVAASTTRAGVGVPRTAGAVGTGVPTTTTATEAEAASTPATADAAATAATEAKANSTSTAARCQYSPEATQALTILFSDVGANEVRQQARQVHGNAGEVLPPGVAELIETMGPINTDDIFLDIGSGIGNVLVQFALTTCIRACIGIEIRSELCELAERRIRRYADEFPLLKKVTMLASDVRDAALSTRSPMRDATIVFANNFLFQESTKLTISRELCEMTSARTLAVSCFVCPRHRSTCAETFCATWIFERKIEVLCNLLLRYNPQSNYSIVCIIITAGRSTVTSFTPVVYVSKMAVSAINNLLLAFGVVTGTAAGSTFTAAADAVINTTLVLVVVSASLVDLVFC